MDTEHLLSPPQSLAVAYAPPGQRRELALLLAFDNRLKGIAANGRELLLQQLRLAWWREQLDKPVEARPRGEPLLAQLAECERADMLVQSMQRLIDAWELLVASGEAGKPQDLTEANRMRADMVFAGYARRASSSEAIIAQAQQAGLQWAQASLGLASLNDLPPPPLPGLKPLNLLLMAAVIDAGQGGRSRFWKFVRLYWHALTGR